MAITSHAGTFANVSRPKEVTRFELIADLGLALQFALSWYRDGLGIFSIAVAAVALGMIVSIARDRSRVGRAIWTLYLACVL